MGWLKRFKIKRLQKAIKVMATSRMNNTATSEGVRKEISLYFELAKQYESVERKKKHPFARLQALACYRSAAALDDAAAQFVVGQRSLEEAKVRDELQNSGVFLSESNSAFLKLLYQDVHAFLLSAEKHQHIKAKRIRGLCYINGWGVPVDKNMGFDLVVASIEQENSWDRVQKIFAELGINNSAFFSELFQHRASRK
jgi:hypothetical protein